MISQAILTGLTASTGTAREATFNICEPNCSLIITSLDTMFSPIYLEIFGNEFIDRYINVSLQASPNRTFIFQSEVAQGNNLVSRCVMSGFMLHGIGQVDQDISAAHILLEFQVAVLARHDQEQAYAGPPPSSFYAAPVPNGEQELFRLRECEQTNYTFDMEMTLTLNADNRVVRIQLSQLSHLYPEARGTKRKSGHVLVGRAKRPVLGPADSQSASNKSQSTASQTANQPTAPHPAPYDHSELLINPLTSLRSVPVAAFRLEELTFVDGNATQKRVVLATMHGAPLSPCIDLDIGIRVPSSSVAPARKNVDFYLLHKEFNSVRGLTLTTVTIGSRSYSIHLSSNPTCPFCLAVPEGHHPPWFDVVPFTHNTDLLTLSIAHRKPCQHSFPKGQWCTLCGELICTRTFSRAEFERGESLWVGGCGGVRVGYTCEVNEASQYDLRSVVSNKKLVVKRFFNCVRASDTSPHFAQLQSGDASFVWVPLTQCVSVSNGMTSAQAMEGFVLREAGREGGPPALRENPVREAELMAHLARHVPRSAEYFPAFISLNASTTDLFLSTEKLASENLFNITDRRAGPQYPEAVVKPIIKRLLEALHLLHEHGIAHCDVKFENITFRVKAAHAGDAALRAKLEARPPLPLTDEDLQKMEAMLIDFGQAEWDIPTVTRALLLQPSATPAARQPWYRALAARRSPPGDELMRTPEHFDHTVEMAAAAPNRAAPRSFCLEKVDMWQLGIVMHRLLTGANLFVMPPEEQREEFMSNLRTVPNFLRARTTRWTATSTVSEPCMSLLLDMLNPDSATRISAAQALKSDWF